MLDLIREDLKDFVAYESARSKKVLGSLFLNANESPFGTGYNRYPEPQPELLLEKLANLYGIGKEQLLVTRGSDEAIDLLVRLFCTANKDSIMLCPPTFGMYEVAAKLQGIEVVEIPLISDDFALNVKQIIQQWTPKVKLIFLCSPNNPTGNLMEVEKLIELCNQFHNKCLIVVDEAYIEFAKVSSLANYINKNNNLIVLRTLSKAYGLAGLRCGCLLAQKAIIEWLNKVIAPYPIPSLVSEAVLESLSDDKLSKIQQQINLVIEERERLFTRLKKKSFVNKIWKSEANFLLLKVSNAENMLSFCNKKGIILRDMSNKLLLKNCIRISIGLPEENEILLKILEVNDARKIFIY